MKHPDANNTPDEELESPELLYLIADKLADLYVSYRAKFVLMGANGSIFMPNRREGDKMVPVKLSNATLCSHVLQNFAVSVFSGPYSAKFMCFDVDDGNLQTVKDIIDVCEESGIPRDKIYASTSGGKGYHVEIFFDRLVYVSTMKRFYEWVCRKAKLNREKVEFRPTPGHSIKLPLSKNFRTGRVCWFLDSDTFEPIERQDYILDVKKVSGDTFTLIADSVFQELTRHEIVIHEEERPEEVHVETFHIQSDELMALTQPGMMHNTIMSIAIYLRNKRYSPEGIAERLRSWIDEQNPDFITDSPSEVNKQIQNAVAWVYSPKFRVFEKSENPEFFEADVKDVLSQKTRLERKVLFLLMYFEKKYGVAKLSYSRISSVCGSCIVGAMKAAQKLEERKSIWHKTGDWRNTDHGPVRDYNSYWVHYTSKDRRGKVHIIDEVPNEKNFENLYYTTLAALADKKELKASLSRAEYKRLEEIANDYME